MSKGKLTVEKIDVQPLNEGDVFVNKRGAIVTTPLTYNRQLAKPGHSWYAFTFDVNVMKRGRDNKLLAGKGRKEGALQISKEFTETHGAENVKRMIIHNVINKIQ